MIRRGSGMDGGPAAEVATLRGYTGMPKRATPLPYVRQLFYRRREALVLSPDRPTLTERRELANLRRAWAVQKRVWGAAFMREIQLRWGRRNLGFAWLFAEPLVFAFPVLIMWSMMRSRPSSAGC